MRAPQPPRCGLSRATTVQSTRAKALIKRLKKLTPGQTEAISDWLERLERCVPHAALPVALRMASAAPSLKMVRELRRELRAERAAERLGDLDPPKCTETGGW